MGKKISKIFILLFVAGFSALSGAFIYRGVQRENIAIADSMQFDEQEATVRAIAAIRPAVVSIAVYDDESVTKSDPLTGVQRNETEKKLKGRGTGFIISKDGYILTNKHVIQTAGANGSYRVILTSGKQYYGQLIGKDPLNDLAVLKIFDKNLPFVSFGDSSNIKEGTSVVAIGNALGIYPNTATKGIVSGLGRSIVASEEGGQTEMLDNVIQTDAEINPGNSGGPLIDLQGKVIGINVALDNSGSSIGFAIPINDARPVIRSILETGRIVRPKLGLRYMMLTPEIAIDNNLKRTTGAWISSGSEDADPISHNGPADKAGLREGDIVFEINAIKVEGSNTLLSIIQKFKPGNKIGMKVLRGDKVFIVTAILEEF